MVRTLHRPPAGGDAPHEVDPLAGVDLRRVHRRRSRTSGIIAAISLVIIAAAIFTAIWLVRGSITTDADALYDSGHRPLDTTATAPDARVLYDSGHRPLDTTVTAPDARVLYDSGHRPLDTTVTEPAATAYDAAIAAAVAARTEQLMDAHDARIEQLLRER